MPSAGLNIFFDVDYTILSIDSKLRPGTVEVFQRLVDDGHNVYVWSGLGPRWEVVRAHGLEPLVSGVYEKPTYRHHERLSELGVEVVPDFVIDDHEEVVHAFGGFVIRRYYYARAHDDQPEDTELERVYEAIQELVAARGEGDGSAVRVRASLPAGDQLFRLQLELERKGLTYDGVVVRIPGPEPDTIPTVMIARVEGRFRVLFGDRLDAATKSRLRALDTREAFEHPHRVLALLHEPAEIMRIRSLVFDTTPSGMEFPDVEVLDGSDRPALAAFGDGGFADIAWRRPVYTVRKDGAVVAACASARESDKAAEAWVVTDAAHRRNGYGRQVVAAWAHHAMKSGRIAFYSHLESNSASAGIARSLRMRPWLEAVTFGDS